MRVLMAVSILSRCCQLSSLRAGVGRRCYLLFIVRVVHVPRPEPEQRCTRVDVLPVVVGIRHVERALVVSRVIVAVPDQGGLPVVMEVGAGACQCGVPGMAESREECSLGNGDKVGAVRGVDQPIVKVLVVNEGRVELAMVHPDIGAFLRECRRQHVAGFKTQACQDWHTSIFNASPLSLSTNEETMFRTIRLL